MADTTALFETGTVYLGTVDPFDFLAVLVPIVTVQDLVNPSAMMVTSLVAPVALHAPLIFTASDNIALRAVVVTVKFSDGNWETAYDGAEFGPRYRDSNLTVGSAMSWTFTLIRTAGWYTNARLAVLGFDSNGNNG